MTIEELNKLIAEELKAYLNENEDEDMDAPEADGDDDIEVTTDEPDVEDGEEAMDLLRQIYDMIRPQVEPKGGEEPEMDMDMGDEEEGEDDEEEGEEEMDEEVLNEEQLNEYAEYMETMTQVIEFINQLISEEISKEAFWNEIGSLMKRGGPAVVLSIAGGLLATGTAGVTAIQGVMKAIPKAGESLQKVLNTVKRLKGKGAINAKEAIDNHTFFRGDNVGRTVVKAKDVQGTREKASLKEGFDGTSRFQKLANIKK